MRKLLVIATVAAAVVAMGLLLTPAWASSAGGAVRGTGTLGQFGDPTVRVNAAETLAGAQGRFVLSYPDDTSVQGDATCLFVSGNTAYLTGQILLATGPQALPNNFAPGHYIIIGVVGNGALGSDLLNFSPGLSANPGCGPNFAATPVFQVVEGRYLVNS